MSSNNSKQVIGYTTNWSTYARNYQISDIPQDVTHIHYAFFPVQDDGTAYTKDPWADYQKNGGNLKMLQDLKKTRQISISLSILGWTFTQNASIAFGTPENRQNFVNSLKNIESNYPGLFDGWDIDWEYPSNDNINYGNSGNIVSPKDSDNYIELLSTLRSNFPQKTISICVTADPDKMKFDVKKASTLVDKILIMTYDFSSGNWGSSVPCVQHQTNPRKSSVSKYSCEASADFYLNLGVPSTKLFIGGTMYSRGFSGVSLKGSVPLGGTYVGNSTDTDWEAGVKDYKNLPVPGSIEIWDDEAKAHYSWDQSKGVVNTYDTIDSVKEKCKIINEKNLGGIIFWELSGDKKGSGSLYSSCINYFKGAGNAGNTGSGSSQPSQPSVPQTPPVQEVQVPIEDNQKEIIYSGNLSASIDNSNFYSTSGTLYKLKGKNYLELKDDLVPTVPVVPNTPTVPQTPQIPSTPTVPQVPNLPQNGLWKEFNSYKIGDIVTDPVNNKSYKCVQSHTAMPGWFPRLVPALFSEI